MCFPKRIRAGITGGVAQVVEHLFSKHKALTSTPSTTKNKKLKNQKPKTLCGRELYNLFTNHSKTTVIINVCVV
jgi:hypothetical protein